MAPRSVLAASLFVSLALFAGPGAALVIDDFEAGDFTLVEDSSTTGAANTEVSGLPNGNVIGGVRQVRSRVVTSDPAAVSTVTLVTTPLDDAAVLTVTGFPGGSADYDFIYDGLANLDNDGRFGLLGVDLSGFTAIEVEASAPTANAQVRLTLWSPALGQNAMQVPLVDGITSIPLSGFTLDLADIRAIRVSIRGLDDLQVVSLSSIRAVPEPGTALLLVSGLGGLAWRRHRVRRSRCA